MGISSQGNNVRESENVIFLHADKIICPKTCDYMLFLSQMPFSAIDKVCDFLYVPFFLSPLRDLFFPTMYGNISHLFDEITSLSYHPFGLVSESPWQPLFISKLSSFLPQDILFSNNLKKLTIALLCLLFSFPQKISSFSSLSSGVLTRGHWKSLIMIKKTVIQLILYS